MARLERVERKQLKSWAQVRRIWLFPMLALGVATTLMLGVPFLWDWFHRDGELDAMGPIALVFNYDIETLQNALGNLAQTVTAVVGVVITVVAIVVQLAATRYTPRVTDLFLRERTNFLVLGFFVVSAVMAIWVSLAVGNGFLPRVSVIVAVFAVSLSLLMIIPYFYFVFDFLDPEKVVSRIEADALDAATPPILEVEQSQITVLRSVENLADIAMAAVGSNDKLISARAVDAMRELCVLYTATKIDLPREWSQPCLEVCKNPDFVAMHPEALDDLVRESLWLEWKVLRQFQAIYNEALKDSPDMNYLIAIDTRYLGEAALSHGLEGVVGLVLKFFNTYMRATLNKKQVRTAYNVLNQYRQLVEAIVLSGNDEKVVEIANYLRYYGQIANGMGLSFVTETIAYDIASLCELAHREKSSSHDALLSALLELDREAEDAAEEAALRGVRKAHLRLGAFYLLQGDEASARKIFRDMAAERPERMISIKNELLRIKSKDFWEVIDRGANFDYMNDARKAKLVEFFMWFDWSEGSFQPDTAAVKSPNRHMTAEMPIPEKILLEMETKEIKAPSIEEIGAEQPSAQ